jgi:hypothetical protein
MKRLGVALTALLMLGACAQVDAFKAYSRDRGAKTYDSALDSAVYFQCEAASAGSVRRKFATNTEDWEAWKTICDIANGYDPTSPGFDPVTGRVQ